MLDEMLDDLADQEKDKKTDIMNDDIQSKWYYSCIDMDNKLITIIVPDNEEDKNITDHWWNMIQINNEKMKRELYWAFYQQNDNLPDDVILDISFELENGSILASWKFDEYSVKRSINRYILML